MRYALRGVCAVGMFLLCFKVGEAHPWGDLGHTIICEIAFQELEPPVQEKVQNLLSLDSTFHSFSEACTWPDHPRKRGPEHFINLPRTATDVQTDTCPLAPKCLFTAIRDDTKLLATGSTATKQQRLESLKYLGHWVGDIHQPLHVSYKDDRGGNSIRESGPCNGDLHAVWDTCLITKGIGQDANAIAQQLRGEITPEERAQWTNSLPVAWANESYAITITADVEYCVEKQGICQYAENRKEFHQGDPERTVTVKEAYIAAHTPTVKQQLKKAGVRLGHLLNTTLGSP